MCSSVPPAGHVSSVQRSCSSVSEGPLANARRAVHTGGWRAGKGRVGHSSSLQRAVLRVPQGLKKVEGKCQRGRTWQEEQEPTRC